MVAALLIPRALRSTDDHRLMLTGAAVATVGTAAATAVSTLNGGPAAWIALATTWSILGMGTSMINTPSARILRRRSDETTRTSIFTAQFSLSHAAFLFTYPVAGWVGAQFGQFTAAAVLTGLATLAGLSAARLWSRSRDPVVASA